jgi:hypothetical protein
MTMAKFKIAVSQSFKAYRTIYIDVEAEDRAAAIAAVADGARQRIGAAGECTSSDDGPVCIPEFNDPRWHTVWDLQDEEVS